MNSPVAVPEKYVVAKRDTACLKQIKEAEIYKRISAWYDLPDQVNLAN